MAIKLKDLKKEAPLSPEIFDFIAGELLNFSPAELKLKFFDTEITAEKVNKFKSAIEQAAQGTPPQYIFKKAYFASEEFYVDERVLIPRPETELLIELAKTTLIEKPKAKVLDIGTGSGIIAITLKKLFPEIQITAADISAEALEVAKKNIDQHDVDIKAISSDLFSNVPESFDLICANLPYIDPSDHDLKELRDPKIALVSDDEGFDLIEKTLRSLSSHLNDKGVAIFEIGYNHEKRFNETCEALQLKSRISKDLSGFTRIAIVTKL